MTIFLTLFFLYFWANAYFTGIVAAEETKQKGDGKAKVKVMILTLLFGLPMLLIIHLKRK